MSNKQSETPLTCLRPGAVIADCADNELNNEWILWITLRVVMSSRHHCSRLDPPRLGGDQTFIFIFISPVLGSGEVIDSIILRMLSCIFEWLDGLCNVSTLALCCRMSSNINFDDHQKITSCKRAKKSPITPGETLQPITEPLLSEAHHIFSFYSHRTSTPSQKTSARRLQLYHFLLVVLPFHCTCTL